MLVRTKGAAPGGPAADPVLSGDRVVENPDPAPRDGGEASAATPSSPTGRVATLSAAPAQNPSLAWLADSVPDAGAPGRPAPAATGRRFPAGVAPEPADAVAMRVRLDNAIASAGSAPVAPAAQAETRDAAVPAAAAAAPPPPPDPGAMAAANAQIVRAMVLAWRDNVGEARVRLDPESLGGLTVVLHVERGVVTATLATDLPAVRDAIHAHERELRAGLASRGLDLGRLVVTADPGRGRREPDTGQRVVPRRSRHPAAYRPFDVDA